MCWQVRIQTAMPGFGMPNRATYISVMSLQPSIGGGSSPRKGKCCTQRTQLLTGLAPCTRINCAGDALDAELDDTLASQVANIQIQHRAGVENRLRGRNVELW